MHPFVSLWLTFVLASFLVESYGQLEPTFAWYEAASELANCCEAPGCEVPDHVCLQAARPGVIWFAWHWAWAVLLNTRWCGVDRCVVLIRPSNMLATLATAGLLRLARALAH